VIAKPSFVVSRVLRPSKLDGSLRTAQDEIDITNYFFSLASVVLLVDAKSVDRPITLSTEQMTKIDDHFKGELASHRELYYKLIASGFRLPWLPTPAGYDSLMSKAEQRAHKHKQTVDEIWTFDMFKCRQVMYSVWFSEEADPLAHAVSTHLSTSQLRGRFYMGEAVYGWLLKTPLRKYRENSDYHRDVLGRLQAHTISGYQWMSRVAGPL